MSQMSNQTIQIQELNHRFESLTNLIQNSSNMVNGFLCFSRTICLPETLVQTSTIIANLQSTLNDLRAELDACKCSKGKNELCRWFDEDAIIY